MYVSQRLLFAEESGAMMSYLDETLQKALLHIRRLFDKFIVSYFMYTNVFILRFFLRMKKVNKFKMPKFHEGASVEFFHV